ncbi:MAG: hypothetical protein WD926_00955 [Patescibacteria group bacterium]
MGFLRRSRRTESTGAEPAPEARHLRIVRPEDERQPAWDILGMTEEQKLAFLTVDPESAGERLVALEDAKNVLEPFLSDVAIGRWFNARSAMHGMHHERPTEIMYRPDGPVRIKQAAEEYVLTHYEEAGRVPNVA